MSMMSAPSSIIFRACWSATAGAMNWPPSEKESGVMLSTPMMIGRFLAISKPSTLGMRPAGAPTAPPNGPELSGVSACPVLTMATRFARRARRSQAPDEGRQRRSVGDFQHQPLGLLDPALDGAVGGQNAGDLALGIDLGHGAGKLGGIAIFQFLDGIDASGLQQPGVVGADALDPHPVGGVGPTQDTLFIEAGFFGQALSLLR